LIAWNATNQALDAKSVTCILSTCFDFIPVYKLEMKKKSIMIALLSDASISDHSDKTMSDHSCTKSLQLQIQKPATHRIWES
jgi:hypothetical protein